MADDIEKNNQLVKAKTSSLQKTSSNIVSRGLFDLALLEVEDAKITKVGLIARGLKDVTKQKTILFVYRSSDNLEAIHLLFDEEVEGVIGSEINIVHRYSPVDAFEYLISNSVDLVISEIKFDNTHINGISGLELLNASKTLYPELPFIVFCAYRNVRFNDPKPDYYIVLSSDLSELLTAIRASLDIGYNTEVVNSKIRENDVKTLLILGIAYRKLNMHKESISIYNQIIKLEPNDVNYSMAHFSLGDTYSKLGIHKEAIEAYKQAIKIESELVTHDDLTGSLTGLYLAGVHYNLGLAYLNIGQKIEAIKEYQILKKLDSKLAEELFDEIHK